MVSKVYVVYDKTAEESGPIQHAKNDGVMLRMYQGLMAKLSGGSSPAEYSLWCIGEYDHEKMEFVSLEIREVQATLSTEDVE